MALVEVRYYQFECKSPFHHHCIGFENCGRDFDDDGFGDCTKQGRCLPFPKILIKQTKMFEFDPPTNLDTSWYLKIGRKELHSGTTYLELLKIDGEVIYDDEKYREDC